MIHLECDICKKEIDRKELREFNAEIQISEVKQPFPFAGKDNQPRIYKGVYNVCKTCFDDKIRPHVQSNT